MSADPRDLEPIPPEDMETCLRVLQQIASARGRIPRSDRFDGLVAKVYREGRRYEKRAERQRQEAEDRSLKAETAMVRIQRDAVAPAVAALPAPDELVRRLNTPETCYVCKQAFTEVHFFYHLLCPTCAAFNYRMRDLHADLTGMTALVTGGRMKIGHQAVLRLLRDGARVIVTTRFPHAAALRLTAEADSAEWLHRVRIYGLDLRNVVAVEAFAQHLLATEASLEIVIHNAAQTVKRPAGFYGELEAQERDLAALPLEVRKLVAQAEARMPMCREAQDARERPAPFEPAGGLPALLSVLPVDLYADHEERVDYRATNSWMLRLDEVSAPEMLEVQLVNSVAPFVLNSRLKPLMTRSPFTRRFIVNVSAMEGQFSRHKTVFHPHTNMAKAALNMMTRTSGEDYAQDGIFMTSVDTGWVTDEKPMVQRERDQRERAFFPPLDIVDGMARIYHPVAHGITRPETPFWGVFLKDYAPCPW